MFISLLLDFACLAERECVIAIRWLQHTGFPQYAHLYEGKFCPLLPAPPGEIFMLCIPGANSGGIRGTGERSNPPALHSEIDVIWQSKSRVLSPMYLKFRSITPNALVAVGSLLLLRELPLKHPQASCTPFS